MLIKDLIQQLEELYAARIEDVDVMGEPTIEIDVFRKVEGHPFHYVYAGIMTHSSIRITPTSDGVYDVLTAFSEEYPNPDTR